MMNPLNEWIKKANSDLNTAKVLLDAQSGNYDQICFHCQQAIEKFLKAYLLKHGAEISKTHDLYKLTTACSKFNPDFLSWEEAVFNLTIYSVDFRYPGDDATKEEATEAYNYAEKFSTFIIKELNK